MTITSASSAKIDIHDTSTASRDNFDIILKIVLFASYGFSEFPAAKDFAIPYFGLDEQ